MDFKNKTFEIFGSKWSISFADKLFDSDGDWKWGESNVVTKEIKVSTKDENDNPLRERDIKLTILHELFHAIFNEGQYLASHSDEPLVEWSAKCILSLLEQEVI